MLWVSYIIDQHNTTIPDHVVGEERVGAGPHNDTELGKYRIAIRYLRILDISTIRRHE